MSLTIKIQEHDFSLSLTNRDNENPFSTGSIGYHGGGRVFIPSVKTGELKEHMVSCTIVEMGSKPK